MGSTSSKPHDSNPTDLGTLESHKDSATSISGLSQPPALYYGSPNHHAQASRNSDTDMDMEGVNSPRYVPSKTSATTSTPDSSSKNDIVPMVFRWEHGGRNVCITGTFNGWSAHVPMHRSGNDFTYIANLPRGKHAYKFVVDDEWRFAPDQPTVADVDGNINNYVDVSDFASLADVDLDQPDDNDQETVYGRFIPDIDEYTKEPPPLPPHLRHIMLNKAPPSVDCRLLPVPQHVALNHLYSTAIKDGMIVLGITQRYKQKFVTTVYYSLMPGSN
ncbi:hypothetical protein Ae201684P_016954 [Aphanomyces euteiches]|uniref:Association with the SNF1 complex (ASC) domain-containing protein n=1 Tax=Aphanomyces euteiches TaxID=100861 RepID=A0A6G0XIX8_9STRA|nr:hypothetical protein Ae201684_004256 [Aphanomyces euteiches]KAH9094345.1 hypothetical protein Ae201684P_016954 [Aphanomyces euteiches]KAH9140051.1 hypothetical protein AeRB84_015658 [Aphanomyces euteiches]